MNDDNLLATKAEKKRLQKAFPTMNLRAKGMKAIRTFFEERDFLEVFTPVRIPTAALEDYIEAIPSGDFWLRTSPEFHMKRLLGAGYPRIFQTGACFRREEHGARHLSEFTMLEWYRAGGNWRDVLQDTEELLAFVAERTLATTKCTFRGHEIDFGKGWEELTVDEAFQRYAGIPVNQAIEQGEFELILCDKVEPHLGVNGRPTALTEYPLACSGLSAQIPGRPDRVERWEVYLSGLELGNACSELCDYQEQKRRFDACTELRAREGRDQYGIDMPFLNMIQLGMPKAAGVAIGLDRLFMALCGLDNIGDSVAFEEN